MKTYGKIKDEARLEQAIVARDIAKTIMDYGVSQYQIAKIIYLLSLELEDRELSDDLITVVREALGENSEEESEENKIIVR
tara:strand:+ start:920 stop:1162 length:243 start_codon:yes stop_codon:yes gene_type:complete